MGVLHLVPVSVLIVVSCWLLWPVVVEPFQRGQRGSQRFLPHQTDNLADVLFSVWSERGTRKG